MSQHARRLTAIILVLFAVLVAQGPASHAATTQPTITRLTAPVATAADTDYGPLRRIGVSAGAARLTDRTLRVTITLRQRTSLRLSIVDGDRISAFAKATLKRGRYRFSGRVRGAPRGQRMQLRVTARNLATRKLGRQRYPITIVNASPTPRPPGPATPAPAGNRPPSKLSLTNSSVAENQPAGATVGALSTTDPDAMDKWSYTLVSGAGDTDNGDFTIDGSLLKTKTSFDFEQRASRSVRVRVSDNHGAPFEQAFTITVTNANDAPTGLALAPATVAENQPAGAVVGTLTAADQDAGDTRTFTVVPGGDASAFTIDGAALKTAAPFDFETKAAYSVRVKVSDGAGASEEKTFAVTVTDVNDAPIVLTTTGPTPYTENDPATVIDSGVTVADADDAQLSGAVVRIATGREAGDVLSFTPSGGVTGAYDAASGTLELDGDASVATYEDVLATVAYRHAGDAPAQAGKTIEFSAADADGAGTPSAKTVQVTAVNDKPVVTTTSTALGYDEGDGEVAIDLGVGVSDVDSPLLTGATVSVAGWVPTEDELVYATTNGITGTFDDATGTLTLDGDRSPADYQAALQAVKYSNTSSAPLPTPRTATFRVTDSASADSDGATRDITVNPVDNTPDVATGGGSTTFVEDGSPVVVDNDVTITDPDSTHLTEATVQITGAFAQGDDVLALPAQPNITGSYNAGTGTLTLSGTAPVSEYETALEAVTYENTSENPSTTQRTISFAARDTTGYGQSATRGVDIAAADDNPVAVNDSATVAEDASATAVDVLANDTDVDAGPKSVASVTQPANGSVTITGGGTGVSYTPNASFCNATPDTFDYTLTPGGSSATVSVTVTCTDDAPVAVNDSATVAEDSGATAVDVLANDTDSDGGTKSVTLVSQPDNGSVTITGGGSGVSYTPNANFCNATPETFTYTLTPGGSTANVSVTVTCVDDTSVAVDDSATVAEDSGATPINVLANDSDPDGDPLSVQSVTQPANGSVTITGGGTGVSYTPNSEFCTSPGSPDTFKYTLSPSGTEATVSVTVTCTDDLPVAVADNATVTEDSSNNALDVLANDTDTDGGPKSIVSVTQPAGGAVTITGGGTGVAFTPSANACGADSFTYTLNGGSSTTVTLSVTCANDAPVVAAANVALTYTEGDGAVAIDPGVDVSEVDGESITGATVSITTNFAAGQDALAWTDNDLGDTIVRDLSSTTQTLVLTGTASAAAYQAALRAVTFENTSQGPSTLQRTVTFTVTDTASSSGSDTRAIGVVGVNDPPTAVDDTGSTDEDTPLSASAPGVLANDTDVDPGDTKTVTKLNNSGTLTGTSSKGGAVTINANGSYSYTPAAQFQSLSTGQSDTDSFTYTMRDAAGAESTATVNLTIAGVSDAPTGVADNYDAIGNTGLFMDTTKPAGQAGKIISGSIIDNDTDPDTPNSSLSAVPVSGAATTGGGTITIESDGDFTYHPDDGDLGTDTYQYSVSDGVATGTGTITFTLTGQAWYVRNDAAAGGDGTSDTPFDTLSEAETASGIDDTTFVYDGDNTSVDLDTGYAMASGERLIGEHEGLVLDPDKTGALPPVNLLAANSGAKPTLTATNEDVVDLDDDNEVRGFVIDPNGTGGGIAGASGDTGGGTIDDVDITDAGTAGQQPGLELDGTTGIFSVSNFTVTNGGSSTAIGVRLNNADRALFVGTGTNTIATTGAKALDAASTNLLSSQWDAITVTGSGSGGVRLSSTTGAPELGDGAGTDLSLQTTSGATAALDISSSNSVSVAGAGTDAISATGGPAVDIRNSNGSTFDFDSVSSASSGGDGINLDTNLTTPFTATTGAISGATGISVDVNGGGAGGGDVSYGGAINDGSGPTAIEITGRTGSTVTLSGNIADGNDAGGGVAVTGNSAGTTTLSGTSKVFNTGASDAILFQSSDGHTFALTGGGTDVDATSGRGVEATSSGTFQLSGAGNTIDTTTGRALNITNTDIAAGDVILQRITSNGASNGIVLDTTGTSGNLAVTGAGGACATNADPCSGGTIQSTTGDAISLASTRDVSLTRMKLVNNLGNGIRGSSVTNMDLVDSVVDNNGNDAATDEAGLHFTNLLGTANVSRVLVAASPEDNARIVNSSGTLTQLNVTDSTFRDTDAVSPGNNGLLIQADGTASITADVLGGTFLRNRANGVQVITNSSGSMDVEVDDSGSVQSTFNDNNIGVNLAHNSSGSFRYGVRDLTLDGLDVAAGTGGSASPININLGSAAAASSVMQGTVSGNTMTNSDSSTGPGIRVITNGAGTLTTAVTSNNISEIANRGIEMIARDGSSDLNATVTNNTVTLTHGLAADAIRVDSGSVSGDTTAICADIRDNAATTIAGFNGVRVRQRFTGTFNIADPAGGPDLPANPSDAAVSTFLSQSNGGASALADSVTTSGFEEVGGCPTPS